ncbi:unnamed protein product [Symbiodinium microadriaticum]|nr:unnamed protein product [Symbiodinium microadriaticum]
MLLCMRYPPRMLFVACALASVSFWVTVGWPIRATAMAERCTSFDQSCTPGCTCGIDARAAD